MTMLERRKYARRPCTFTVEVRFEGQNEALEATLADICLGGCYVSTISPPPLGTTVLLCFREKERSAIIAGKTVTCMPGSGMGIEFTGGMDGESAARLQSLIDLLDDGFAQPARAAI